MPQNIARTTRLQLDRRLLLFGEYLRNWTSLYHPIIVNCQRGNRAKKRGWLSGRIITPRNVGKNSQILRNPANFVNQHVFLLLDSHWDSPKLPWGMQRIQCVPSVFHTNIMPFKRLFVLWHSLTCILFKFIFYTSNTFRPILARFSHILLYTIFYLMYITSRNIFLIPDDAVAWNLLIIFNFISQRPHLNYIFLSNVYSFDTMEFSMKHKC